MQVLHQADARSKMEDPMKWDHMNILTAWKEEITSASSLCPPIDYTHTETRNTRSSVVYPFPREILERSKHLQQHACDPEQTGE